MCFIDISFNNLSSFPGLNKAKNMQRSLQYALGQSDCWYSLNQLTDERSMKVSESWKEALESLNFCVLMFFYEFTGINLFKSNYGRFMFQLNEFFFKWREH